MVSRKVQSDIGVNVRGNKILLTIKFCHKTTQSIATLFQN